MAIVLKQYYQQKSTEFLEMAVLVNKQNLAATMETAPQALWSIKFKGLVKW